MFVHVILRVCLITVFSPYFFVRKNNFLFLILKNLFGNPKWIEKKKKKKNVLKT